MLYTTAIIEGPAGAGKSYFVESLVRSGLWQKIPNTGMPRPRSYEGRDGELLAILKDIKTVTEAQWTEANVVLDRYVLSSFVYAGLRRERDRGELEPLRPGWTCLADLSQLMAHATSVRWSVWEALRDRGVEFPRSRPLHWIVLLPELQRLLKQRQQVGRAFPFDASRELAWYTWIVENWEINGLNQYGSLQVLTEPLTPAEHALVVSGH